jgi:disulfide oxidoreductase YuzD
MLRIVLSGVALGVFGLSATSAWAHTEIKNMFEKEYAHLKVTCNACHVQGKGKEVRNEFGAAIHKKVADEDFSKKFKEIKDKAEKKKYMEETILPAIKKSVAEVVEKESNSAGDKWADLIKNATLPGVTPKKD